MDSPIVKATWQAAVMSALSNILAQAITCWRTQSAWHVNIVDLFQFVLFSILATPPNYLWQSWLEARYPARTQAASPGDEKHEPRESSKQTSTTLNKKNTAIKFALDQTIGATFNTVLFIAGIGLIRGQSLDSIQHDVATQFSSMIFAGQKFWPLVSILCYTVVPFDYRMLVGSIAGLFWGIYLSLIAGSKT